MHFGYQIPSTPLRTKERQRKEGEMKKRYIRRIYKIRTGYIHLLQPANYDSMSNIFHTFNMV
jgi:hypothetical protein